MSYLICLYVYYHGNNLGRFGFEKGSQEITNQNQGTYRPTDVTNLNVSDEVKSVIQTQLEKEQNTPDDYFELMRKAVIESQNESMKLVKAGLVHNETISNTPDYVLGEINDYGNSNYDIFDELNGFM